MIDFGHVIKIFIGAGFPRMGFPGYIVCLYVVACFNVYFSLIIILYCSFYPNREKRLMLNAKSLQIHHNYFD